MARKLSEMTLGFLDERKLIVGAIPAAPPCCYETPSISFFSILKKKKERKLKEFLDGLNTLHFRRPLHSRPLTLPSS